MRFFILLFLAICLPKITITNNDATKYHLYFLANYNQLEHNIEQAQKNYTTLFNTYNIEYAYPGFLIYLAQTQQFDKIINLVPKLEKLHSTDLQTNMTIIAAFDAVGKKDETLSRLKKLTSLYPENPELTFFTASYYAENNKYSDALATIDTYLTQAKNSSKAFLFYFLKAQIYARLSNTEQAKVNVKKSLELSPEFDQGWLLLGLINELAGNLDEAISNYQTTLKIVGSNPILERQIMQLQLKKEYGVAQEVPPYFSEALKAYNNKEHQKAFTILKNNKNYESHIPSCLLMVELLCKMNNVAQAVAFLNKKIVTDPLNDTWYRALHLLHKAGVSGAVVLDAYSQSEKLNATNTLPLLYKADIYLRSNDHANALTYLKKSLDATQQASMKVKILYQIALIYFQQEKWDLMHNVLLEGKKLTNDFLPLLNLLAYYYATVGKNISEAEHIMKTVLSKDKNPHYYDTYALILYKQNKVEQSQKLLLSVLKKVPNDSTMHYHLAKTFHKQGMLADARKTLEHALQFCSQSNEKNKYTKCLAKWAQ